MASRQTIESFLAERALAVVGVSRSGRKFGNSVFTELKTKGYTVYPVNPSAQTIDGERCYATVGELPKDVGGVVAVVPPAQTERIVRDIHGAGISKVWMQRGAESKEALAYCAENGMEAVSGECILMFAPPVESFHKFHRFFRRIFGGLPR